MICTCLQFLGAAFLSVTLLAARTNTSEHTVYDKDTYVLTTTLLCFQTGGQMSVEGSAAS